MKEISFHQGNRSTNTSHSQTLTQTVGKTLKTSHRIYVDKNLYTGKPITKEKGHSLNTRANTPQQKWRVAPTVISQQSFGQGSYHSHPKQHQSGEATPYTTTYKEGPHHSQLTQQSQGGAAPQSTLTQQSQGGAAPQSSLTTVTRRGCTTVSPHNSI
jgi:hypothetical protein